MMKNDIIFSKGGVPLRILPFPCITQERDKKSPNNLYILRENENVICVDFNDKDWFFPLVVKC